MVWIRTIHIHIHLDQKWQSAKVIYGIFKSVKDANIAMDNLPASVKATQSHM